MAPRALSEGLLGGRLFAASPQGRQGPPPGEDKPPPKPRIPVGKLKQGMLMEGRIIRTAAYGLFVDVGATRQGLLRWRDCRGVPRQLLRRDEVLSNLTVIRVCAKKRRFSLSVQGVGVDDENLEEEAYDEILRRIAGWAGVTLPAEGGDDAAAPAQAAASEASSASGGAGRQGRAEGAAPPPQAARPAPPAAAAPAAAAEGAQAEASPRRSPRRRGRRRPPAQAPAGPSGGEACEAGGGGLRDAGAAKTHRGAAQGRKWRRRKPVSE